MTEKFFDLSNIRQQFDAICEYDESSNKLHLAGKTITYSEPAVMRSWYFGELAQDFEWEFIYKPLSVEHNEERFCFHCPAYCLMNSGNFYTLGILGNCMDNCGIALYNPEYWTGKLENPFSYFPFSSWEENTEYHFKITVNGSNIKVWVKEIGDETPVLSCDVPDNLYVDSGYFRISSWNGDFNICEMKMAYK